VGKRLVECGEGRGAWRTALAGALVAVGLLLTAPTASAFTPAQEAASLDDTVREDLEFAEQQLRATAASVPPNRYPAATAATGGWTTTGSRAWTSGFFPGSLWLAYGVSRDPELHALAASRLAALEGQKRDTTGNDQGFKLLNSFGHAYRLTGDDAYRRVVLRGADSLASRFSPVVGATRSWGDRGSRDFTVIVDNLMNLELLFWASKHGGDPAWYGMALSHALRTMRDHVRRDGSTFHVVDYDPGTGRVTRKRTRQGYARGSTWSRGQAWAVYGFTMAYRESGDRRLLDAAQRTADWFIAHLPSDSVPFWDFDAPGIPNAPRDSSAAAIAASGLLELAALEPDAARSARYSGAADSIIASLSSASYLARGESTQAILLHGTQDRPRGNYDTGLVFGDYYFIEALLRYGSPPEPPAGPQLGVSARRVGAGLRVRVRSDQPGRVRAALIARRGTARKLRLGSAPSGVLARGQARLREPGRTRLRVRVAPRARRFLRGTRHARVTLSVLLRPPGGDASATAVPLRL
jgi:unsaturated chondroitin disaccharide hydrolase